MLSFFLFGCVNKNEKLHGKILTAKNGCDYFITTGLGDTVFLTRVKDKECDVLK